MSVALKSLHILGACLFLGNISVSALWKVLADRTGNYAVVRFATRLVNITDTVFTGLGAALLLWTGHLLAANYGGVLANDWIVWSYGLFGVSGAIWVAVLLPIQFKQAKMLHASTTEAIPHAYYRLAVDNGSHPARVLPSRAPMVFCWHPRHLVSVTRDLFDGCQWNMMFAKTYESAQ